MARRHSARSRNRSASAAAQVEHTIGEILEYLCTGASTRRTPPSWPPDAFAITALLLQRSGGYRHALSVWPPFTGWETRIRRDGYAWRNAWNRGESAPKSIRVLWKTLLAYKETRLDSICQERDLCETLLQICGTADASSYALGLPTASREDHDPFWEHGGELLFTSEHGSTLCESIHTTRLRVLPKMHTPQTGLTIRSFSHNLALCGTDEMRPEWAMLPSDPERHRLNLLLVPWPFNIKRSQFEAASGKVVMPGRYGCFEYHPLAPGRTPAEKLEGLLQASERKNLRIDLVVFPELSLTMPQYQDASKVARRHNAKLLAGVAAPSGAAGVGGNYACFERSLPGMQTSEGRLQAKHHRWRLDGDQIERYGLQKVLNPRRLWWEHIPLEERSLHIIAMRPWLTISVLICEDLARPDPAGDLLRAVGPNLVIALLLDGPQLPHRWPGRYAMALADDPGSSVLTLTSLGMAKLGSLNQKRPSRSIALWKNGQSGTVEAIEMPAGKEAVVLATNIKEVEEFTADGRSDGRAAGIPTLKKIHFL